MYSSSSVYLFSASRFLAKLSSSNLETPVSRVRESCVLSFVPPPYKNKQDYKGGTNDKTHNSHTRETSVSRINDDSLTRNLGAENKIQKMMNTMTIRQ